MTQARMEAIVQEFDPLFESLVGGTAEDRASIWGQGEQESNANPAAEEQGGSDRYGIGFWQHSFSRHTDLVNFASSLGKSWQDMETQVRFVAQELNGTHKHVWHQITKVATTLQSKTETAMALFEAPEHWREEIKNPGTTTAGLPRRLQGAEWALAEIKSKGKPMATDTEAGLATLEQDAEAAANALLTKQFPQFAPMVIALEKSLIEPMLPTINAKLGAQIDSNKAAHAVLEIIILAVGYGMTWLLPKITGATK